MHVDASSFEAISSSGYGARVFVDADAVSTAIRKIRQVLGDTPGRRCSSKPCQERGIFIAEVEAVQAAALLLRPSVPCTCLPFENLGGTPGDYIADGFTEEATTALGQIDPAHLSVIGRTSVMGYKRTTKSPRKSVASSAPRM